jgi:ArsR family transcriptional regulator
MTQALLDTATRVICVDRSAGMLAEAKKRLARRASRTVLEYRPGDLDALPIADAELDGLVCGMVLHHLESPERALAEMLRVLKPGGAAVVLELAPHREAWMRRELGDLHLGIPPTETLAALEQAGFEEPLLGPVEDRDCPRRPGAAPDDATVSLSLYIARGRKPRS